MLDTRDKRASAVNISMPWRGLLPQPGTMTNLDRQQLAYMYRGISAGEGTGPGDGRVDWLTRARRRGVR